MKIRDAQRPPSSELFSVISGRLLPDDTPDHELMAVEEEEQECRVIPFPLSRVRRPGRGTPPPPPPRTVA